MYPAILFFNITVITNSIELSVRRSPSFAFFLHLAYEFFVSQGHVSFGKAPTKSIIYLHVICIALGLNSK